MSFKTDLTADASDVFLSSSELAENLITSAAATVRGIIDFQAVLGQFDLNGQASTATITVLRSELSTPARYQTLTATDGTVWRIDQILSHDADTWNLLVTTDRRVS